MNKLIITALLAMMCGSMKAQSEIVLDTTYVDIRGYMNGNEREAPKYKSGMASAVQYLTNNLKYPKEAEKNGVEGKVMMEFMIEKDGTLSHIRPIETKVHFFNLKKLSEKTGQSEQELIKHYGKMFQEEGVRVLSIMPKWKPGKMNGQPVRVKNFLPLHFGIPRFTGMGR